jgi:multiple sugar transport system ATP-binding protein
MPSSCLDDGQSSRVEASKARTCRDARAQADIHFPGGAPVATVSAVSLEHVTKVYPGGHQAVRQLDLEIEEGELMVLVGPSGCGKTTVLRMIAGLEEITTGTLRIGDRVVNDVSPKDRDIAMVFQNYALYPHMTVAANIAFALRIRGLSKREAHAKVADVARLLGLTEFLEKRPAQLSGGQRQRVAMGRAIVREPTLFLMDEPLSNLDAKLRVQMRAEISQLQRHLGVATLFVTHDQTEAMTLGDRIAIMRNGVLQQLDKPQSVYDHPANLFVAEFIGSPAMNLYQAALNRNELRLGSQAIDLSSLSQETHARLRRRDGGDLVVGIRPEHLRLAPDGASPTLTGRVSLVESLGSDSIVHFTLDAHRIHTEARQDEDETAASEEIDVAALGVARVEPGHALEPGQSARFAVNVPRLYFFDLQTGEAIS